MYEVLIGIGIGVILTGLLPIESFMQLQDNIKKGYKGISSVFKSFKKKKNNT